METLSITLFSATPVAAHIARGWNSPGPHRKKYSSFINLFVFYVGAVVEVGLAGSGSRAVCDGWDLASRGPALGLRGGCKCDPKSHVPWGSDRWCDLPATGGVRVCAHPAHRGWSQRCGCFPGCAQPCPGPHRLLAWLCQRLELESKGTVELKAR